MDEPPHNFSCFSFINHPFNSFNPCSKKHKIFSTFYPLFYQKTTIFTHIFNPLICKTLQKPLHIFCIVNLLNCKTLTYTSQKNTTFSQKNTQLFTFFLHAFFVLLRKKKHVRHVTITSLRHNEKFFQPIDPPPLTSPHTTLTPKIKGT